jgi:hypothetical protein
MVRSVAGRLRVWHNKNEWRAFCLHANPKLDQDIERIEAVIQSMRERAASSARLVLWISVCATDPARILIFYARVRV